MRPKPVTNAVAGRPLILHPKIIAAVRDEFVELFKRAFVEQQRDALARREFAGLVLALAAFGPPPASASALRRREGQESQRE
jgi:hypothetical protein